MPSATTAHWASRSRLIASSFSSSLPSPFITASTAINVWAMGTPMLRVTVLSVRSRCRRLMGSFSERCPNWALANPRLPSAFSKSMGFTLCGMALLPTSPTLVRCRK